MRSQAILSTLVRSLPPLLDVLILNVFMYIIFGIIGVQFLGGKIVNRCAASAPVRPPDPSPPKIH